MEEKEEVKDIETVTCTPTSRRCMFVGWGKSLALLCYSRLR